MITPIGGLPDYRVRKRNLSGYAHNNLINSIQP